MCNPFPIIPFLQLLHNSQAVGEEFYNLLFGVVIALFGFLIPFSGIGNTTAVIALT